jgi:isopenicillin-N N-acyltransferase like protein
MTSPETTSNHPTPPSRYRELSVSGSPRELGRQIGDAAGDLIREFVNIALDRVNITMKVSRASAYAVAHASIAYAERYSPDSVEELRGMAEATGLTLEDIMLLQVRNQLKPDAAGGCTSFSLAGPGLFGRSGEGAIVAQNWDNDPELDRFTLAITRHPTGKPAFTSLTQAGLIAYIGFNDAGIGLCLNSLPAPSRPLGVPHYFTVREMFEARSLADVVHAVERAERAIPANIMLATPQGPADLEVTIDAVHVLSDPHCVTHTNHCRHPALAAINGQFPELIQSHSRQARIDQLLASESVSLETIQAILRDHDGWPRSICRHACDDPGTGFWRTVFSVILDPTARCMHVTRGTPCDRNYEQYNLLPE